MKRELIIGIVVVVISVLAYGIYLYYSVAESTFVDNETELSELQDCSRKYYDPNNPNEVYLDNCPEGYMCFEHLSGGLGPEGPLPIEGYGGDKKCHKECFLDKDCPKGTSFCLRRKINTEDTSEDLYLCFSDEEGKIERDQIYNGCLEKKKEIISKNELVVSFSYKSTYEEIEELLKKHGIKIIRKGGLGMNNYIVEPPSEDPLEKICELELDNRIIDVSE